MVICIPQPSDSNLKKIFDSILKGFLNSYTFAENIRKCSEQLTVGTLTFYTAISHELLPTPNKFHYTFNLRDISKVFQGMLMIRPQSANSL
jgi:dynein heavy chain